MGKTTFSGPLRTGKDTGAPSTTTIGHVPVVQIATVAGNASGATNVVLPANCDLIGIKMVVVCAASAATSIASQGVNFRIGRVAGNDAYFGTVKVSGVAPIYEIGVDALNRTNASSRSWIGVSADTQVFVDATAVTSASAVANLGGRIYFTYFQR